ncbi:class I SAM-dependent methyltransferase [Thalassobaculum salexigens]|uniref:class I SAM-dependent methyltransferase n=1 Tax=Thalassobaculum salexigens TaxID=455360 RepID=UPI0012ECB415|nr:class I SAM-dependent methyltransferase [Thalassobaculum salexigens]
MTTGSHACLLHLERRRYNETMQGKRRIVSSKGRLPGRAFKGLHALVKDEALFQRGIDLIRQSLSPAMSFYHGDDMIAWGRNMGFLDEMPESPSRADVRIAWRTYIIENLARRCARLDGDLMEIGCYRGDTAARVLGAVDMTGKRYWLYDLFGHNPGDAHLKLAYHIDGLEAVVRGRFEAREDVRIVAGLVPESLIDGPSVVCFAHIDLNNAGAEVGALEWLLPRMTFGSAIVFDDYGWQGLSNQKKAIDQALADTEHRVIELPTGQGLLLL